MGTGILALPYAFAQLGWFLGISSCAVFGAAAVYSGQLLSTVKNELYPEVTSYSDAARLTFGQRAGNIMRGIVLCTWMLTLPYYIIAAAAALNGAFPWASMCYWQWALVAMLFIAPTAQLRSLHQLSVLSLLSTLAVIVVLLIIVFALIATAPSTPPAKSFGPPPNVAFLRRYNSLGSFVFAFQGQSMFFEILREMREPRDFPKALYASNTVMISAYASIAAVGYGTYGDAVESFLPNTLPAGATRALVGLLLAFHTLVSYLLTAQPTCRILHSLLKPETVDRPTSAARMHWAAITLSLLLANFFVANAIPYFADVQDLIGNLFGACMTFGFPALFFVRGTTLRGVPVAKTDVWLCRIFLFVLWPAFTVFGTISAFIVLVEDLQSGGARPFQCGATGG